MMRKLLILGLVGWAALGALVEDSVVPAMNGREIEVGKYSRQQLAEMAVEGPLIRVMSYNMLMDTPMCNARVEEADLWPHRLPRIVEYLELAQPDVIAAQELMHHQVEELLAEIGQVYAWYGVGEKDGDKRGQHNGLFYRFERFELLTGRVLWISPTPGQCSKDPYEGRARTLTGIHLRDLVTDKDFVVTSCHLSFGSADARAYGAAFINRAIEPLEMPIVVAGDFNTFPNLPDRTHLPFFDGSYLEQVLSSQRLTDARRLSLYGHFGPLSTFTNNPGSGKAFVGNGEPGVLLDHIYVTDGITVVSHGADPVQVDGHYPSDHMPILVDLVLN